LHTIGQLCGRIDQCRWVDMRCGRGVVRRHQTFRTVHMMSALLAS